ncbi:hypothetical protein Tco_0409754 [Tanacetum coccineum]
MISCRGEPNKTKRGPSQQGEGPATAETTDPFLVPSPSFYESGKPPQRISNIIEKGGQGSRWPGGGLDGTRKEKSLGGCVETDGWAALPPANPAISEPVFLIPFNGGLFNSCDSQPPIAY